MPASNSSYDPPTESQRSVLREDGIEYGFIGRLQGLKYEYRRDITDRASLERNFREKFEELNQVRLTNAEFTRLLDEIVTPDVFTASGTLQNSSAMASNNFTRNRDTCLFQNGSRAIKPNKIGAEPVGTKATDSDEIGCIEDSL
jgi:type I restriction enzyme R subunit